MLLLSLVCRPPLRHCRRPVVFSGQALGLGRVFGLEQAFLAAPLPTIRLMVPTAGRTLKILLSVFLNDQCL